MAAQSIRPMVAGNWKMNGTTAILKEPRLLAGMLRDVKLKCDVMVCPPATLIRRAKSVMRGSKIKLGGQDCHAAVNGAHTGDISADMLKDAGASAVIVGHSERRTNHKETDAMVSAKAVAAHKSGLNAIICIGETLDERKGGKTLAVLTEQLKGSVPAGCTASNTVIAYEPVWAIGTGKVCAADEADRVCGVVRQTVADLYDDATAQSLRIQYGGSMKPDNAAELLSKENIDGGLIGGASLKAGDFSQIVSAAAV